MLDPRSTLQSNDGRVPMRGGLGQGRADELDGVTAVGRWGVRGRLNVVVSSFGQWLEGGASDFGVNKASEITA